MKYVRLGSSPIDVSRVCLGTMTWGVQNDQQDANQQLDYAISQGVNFIDTAEMYAIPPNADTYGTTETILGNWLAHNKEKREKLVIATKIAGPGLPYIRNGSKISGESVIQAVDDSLKRLQTDYIDLYQLHWPNRSFPHFSKSWPNQIKFSEADKEQIIAEMLDVLQALSACVDAGKIRYCGLSNETPWGINQYLKLASEHSLPKMVSIQNEFSLLHTKDWPYLIEDCIHQDVAYLPWSPLAAGMLSGKYLNGALPKGSRWTYMQRNGLFRDTPASHQAVAAFAELASKNNLSPATMALAWCNHIDGVTSTIIGATKMSQLKEDIAAFDVELSDELMGEIDRILRQYPSPY